MENESLKSQLLKNLSPEEKLELCTLALAQAAKENVVTAHRFSELVDRLEVVVQRLEAKSWERAINQRLEERKRNGTSP
jgi:hypothetical protein